MTGQHHATPGGQKGTGRPEGGRTGEGEAAPPVARGTAGAGPRPDDPGLTPGGAARALGLRTGELELAVQLGCVRATRDTPGGPLRISREEIARLGSGDRSGELRHWVETVDTTTGAALVAISPARFTRLARTGHLVPVRFYLNRYRTVVWHYLATEVEAFALAEPGMLTGRADPALRARLDRGEDRRAVNWRSKRLGLLLRITTDHWERAAAVAALLDPLGVADLVPDPYERSLLGTLRPDIAGSRPASPAALAVAERLTTADDPDEIAWYRSLLGRELDEARRDRPAPRPTAGAPRSRAVSGPGPLGRGPAEPPVTAVPGACSPTDRPAPPRPSFPPSAPPRPKTPPRAWTPPGSVRTESRSRRLLAALRRGTPQGPAPGRKARRDRGGADQY
ncbi:DUF6397 family protein [Streptomyces sp. NPDC058953]|uniref:DUF6397 family protein n=1 Tax=unclassified Streptomyces TaxID=2593676 RepID=UPI0036A76515